MRLFLLPMKQTVNDSSHQLDWYVLDLWGFQASLSQLVGHPWQSWALGQTHLTILMTATYPWDDDLSVLADKQTPFLHAGEILTDSAALRCRCCCSPEHQHDDKRQMLNYSYLTSGHVTSTAIFSSHCYLIWTSTPNTSKHPVCFFKNEMS